VSDWFGRAFFLDKAASIACDRVVVVLDATPGWAGLARVRRVYGRLAGKFSEALSARLARVLGSAYVGVLKPLWKILRTSSCWKERFPKTK